MSAWRHYIGFYRTSSGKLTIAVAVAVVQALFVLPITWLVRYTFDRVLPAADLHRLVEAAAALLFLGIGGNALTLWTRSRILRITKRAVADLRVELIERCFDLPRSFYDAADRGRLHTTIVQDTERLDIMSNALIAQLLPALVTAVTLCGVLIFLNVRLFAVLLLAAPLLWLFNRKLAHSTGNTARQYHHSFEVFNSGVASVFQMMDVMRMQSAEQIELQRQRANIDDLRLTSAKTALMEAAYGMMHGTVNAVCAALILIVGGVAIAHRTMTAGQLLSFYAGVLLLNGSLGIIMSSIPSIIAGNESLTTLFDFLRIADRLPYSGKAQIDFEGRISLDSVSFGYGDELVLRNASLSIDAGTTVAIVGGNGSGKTTLAHLILGLYRPEVGQIYADGIAFDDIELTSMRRSISVVMQDTVLLSGTVRQNIAYGVPDATESEIAHAARLSTAWDFIEDLPQGFDTHVGENGVQLSGGQRQRVAIARALMRPSRLLILDEPTNHLDAGSVAQLVSNLNSVENRPTILLITHDMDLARTADVSYVLRDGACLPFELV